MCFIPLLLRGRTYGWNTNDNNHSNVACNWTADDYRLPTEAEWEFAARGGNQTHNYTYSGSNDINAVAWYYDNSYAMGSSHPDYGTNTVGTKAPNELGLYDMSGNVWEWTWDIYGSYPSGTQTNPTGANSGSVRVGRGGSWDGNAYDCSVSVRDAGDASVSNFDFGFRFYRVSPCPRDFWSSNALGFYAYITNYIGVWTSKHPSKSKPKSI